MLQQKPSRAVGNSQEIEAGYVVGADIGGTSLRLALADMDGKVVAKWRVSTAGIRDPHVVVDLIHKGVEELLQKNVIERSLLRAVAAGAPGVTDVDDGIVIATSYLMGWRDVPLRALLEARLGVPAAVDNDVNTAAIAEYQIGAAQGVRDFVFIAVGTGIGAGIVLNGRLFHGMDWSAGEIGYLLVPGTSVKPVEGASRGRWRGLLAAKVFGRSGRVPGVTNSRSFPEIWSLQRYLTMLLRGTCSRKPFLINRRRRWPMRSITSRLFSTAHSLC